MRCRCGAGTSTVLNEKINMLSLATLFGYEEEQGVLMVIGLKQYIKWRGHRPNNKTSDLRSTGWSGVLLQFILFFGTWLSYCLYNFARFIH